MLISERSKIVFWYDGICSEDLGIRITPFPEFSAAKPRVTKYSIPGRNGDLTYWDGSFKNVSADISCAILNPAGVEAALTNVNRWMADCGYKKFVISTEPGRYRLARITNAAEIAIRMGVLAPFVINLDCKPQRFFDDETPLIFSGESWKVFNGTGFEALPRIRLFLPTDTTYAKAQTIYFKNSKGEYSITIPAPWLSLSKWIDIDINARTVTNDTGKSVAATTVDTGYPVFCAGNTTISGTDWVEKAELYPRWWTL